MLRNIAAAPDDTHSITALSIALGFTLGLDTKYGYLFTPLELELSKHFFWTAKKSMPYSMNWVKATAIGNASYAMQRSFFYRKVAQGYDGVIALRKLMIKQKIEKAIEKDHVEQVVFLGGGYDIRSLVASLQYPTTQFFDIDKGLTRQGKIQCLSTLPAHFQPPVRLTDDSAKSVVHVNHNLHLIHCDLAIKDLRVMLGMNNFDFKRKTLFIAEGLTTYINEPGNARLLSMIDDIFKEEDELLISYMTKIQTNSTQDEALKNANEHYSFALPANQVLHFASARGLDTYARFAAYDLLGALGDNASVQFYRNNPDWGKEIYYLMKKPALQPNRDKKFEDLPVMECDVKPAPLGVTATSCQLL